MKKRKPNLTLFIVLFCSFVTISSAAERVILKDGQSFTGRLVEEQEDFIRINTGYHDVRIERDRIMSIQHGVKQQGLNTEDLFADTTEQEEPMSNIEYYRSQVQLLNEQINVYKANISFLEEQIEELQKDALEEEAKLKNTIKQLQHQLEERDKSANNSAFKELNVIRPNQQETVNVGYIKKVKFRLSEDIDGYFIGAEYTILSEFVQVKPNFAVYFFDERGLNIATDTNNMKFNIIPRGQEEVITKGIPMSIPDARPYYYYIKVFDKDEGQLF